MNLPARSNPPESDPSQLTHSQRPYAIQRASTAPVGMAPPSAYDDSPVFVLTNMKVALGFPLRSVRRHMKAAIAVFTVLIVMIGVAIALAPKHYYVETKFFAEKNFVMPALNNPRRVVPSEGDSPTRLAAEAVLKRTNLLEIVRQTNLMASWDQLRSPLGKVKDYVMAKVKGPLSDSEKLDAMLGVIEKQMFVTANEGTVQIGLDWTDPGSGYRIVQAAQQNFFEQRHAAEVSLIGESIGILEGHVVQSQRAISEAMSQINVALPRRAAVSIPRPAFNTGPSGPSAEVAALLGELRVKEQTIADISTSRSQRLTGLQTSLTELRTRYGAEHPEIKATEENIKSLSQPSPQLDELRSEEAGLRKRLTDMGVRGGVFAPATQASFDQMYAAEALERLSRVNADSQETPEVTYARSKLKIATSAYEELLGRLEGARIELETARAAFKYRYVVITPARVPRSAIKPKVPLLIVGGLILAVAASLFAAMALDFGGGRVLEPWQVDRQLGVPVLAEVRRR